MWREKEITLALYSILATYRMGDRVQWKNQANKKEGYKIKKGKQITSVTVQKKIQDGQKLQLKLPSNENSLLQFNNLFL